MIFLRKYISILIVVSLLSPLVVQLFCCAHDDHEESSVCISKEEQHFHEYESDCETCKFHLNNFTLNELPLIPLINYKEICSPETFFYSLEDELVISFRLRGPPSFIA